MTDEPAKLPITKRLSEEEAGWMQGELASALIPQEAQPVASEVAGMALCKPPELTSGLDEHAAFLLGKVALSVCRVELGRNQGVTHLGHRIGTIVAAMVRSEAQQEP